MPIADRTVDKQPLKLLEIEFGETLANWHNEHKIEWNEERKAWVITGYQEAVQIFEDSNSFWRDTTYRVGAKEFWRGRHLMTLEGRDHRRMHALHMQLTGETFVEGFREKAGQIARNFCAKLVKQGRAELYYGYADAIVFLIGCEYVGYTVPDEAVMEDFLHQMTIRARWKEAVHSGPGIPLDHPIAIAGEVAIKKMEALLLPMIRERRESPRHDLISLLWQKAPAIFPDWNEYDILATCWSSIDNEGEPLLAGLLYILCRDQELQEKLRRDPSLVPIFVEEGLRFLSPNRLIQRTVKKDVVVGGQQLREGDQIHLFLPLMNRDKDRWGCPYSFDMDREHGITNLSLGYGPTYCVGRYVGRMENEEAVRAMLASTSNLRLDPTAEKPKWRGEFAHSVAPINVILE